MGADHPGPGEDIMKNERMPAKPTHPGADLVSNGAALQAAGTAEAAPKETTKLNGSVPQDPSGRAGGKGRVADSKRKAAKETSRPANKGSKQVSGKGAGKPSAPRVETKGAKILKMIGRPKGATLAELTKATAWQAHSIRGFISTAGQRFGLKIASARNDAGARIYQSMQ
jgi:hypothetical protein